MHETVAVGWDRRWGEKTSLMGEGLKVCDGQFLTIKEGGVGPLFSGDVWVFLIETDNS